MRIMSKNHFLLNAEKIAACCATSTKPLTIEVILQTESTNTDLMARVPTLGSPTLLVAETQTAGRGRAGRHWLSSPVPGSSLTFSLAWPFLEKPQALLGLPLAVGVGLAKALASMGVTVQLKWPNDVLREGKKLAGVLIETTSYLDRTWAIIGVGLNLLIPKELEQEIGQPVADAIWLAQMDRNEMLAVLITHLISCLQQFSRSGLSTFLPTWNSLHAYAGQQVCIVDQDKIIQQGIALGVNNLGCLLLQDRHGVVWPVMAGNVSLRLR
ncbi:MAG: biotin--[acetyl-CoA-carboxylase] ligase [Solimicrobium sp.]|jgi:BirA family biotin operon repressor/biotin-[acetyl-CoA-carboxylase] ligase|nr:biotin--[acetyl-CoA-carboxylase] ligase [Solimicrobium sp.]